MKKIKEEGIDVKNEYFAGEIGVTLYPPKVSVKNDIFPPREQLRNCTTCKRGKQMPADKLTNSDYHYWCKWDGKEHIGIDMKYLDNTCENFDKKRFEDLMKA